MLSILMRSKIAHHVEKSPISTEAIYDDRGELLGFKIKSLEDLELFYVAHPSRDAGVYHLKRIYREKLEKDAAAGRPMPFQ